MYLIFHLLLFYLLNINILECFEKRANLIGTHIMYRHGDRSPAFSYPKSTIDEFFWTNGFGQLTRQGQIQQIRLGQYFRERYSELLNLTYVASEVIIQSSDYERTLMSAYANLLGLYPTSKEKLDLILSQIDDDQWPEVLPWQPIPVHTRPKSTDYIMGVSECPYFFELVEQISNSEVIQNLSLNYRELFDKLENWTGSKIDTIFDGWILADIILIEALYNVSSSWVDSFVLDQLEQITDLSFYHLFDSSETNRIIGGPIIDDIMDNIQNLITNKSKGWKAKIYSGHDASIVAVLAFFGANYIHHPPYCATLFFDLYHLPEDNSYALKVEYLNSTNGGVAYPIKLPPCSDEMCPIDILNRWIKTKLPSKDMTKECISRKPQPSSSQSEYENNSKLYLFLFIIFFFK